MAPTPQIQNINDLVQTLQMLSANDTKMIKKAEKILKNFLKNPTNATYLVLVLRNTQSEVPVRHHAALLLKKKIGGFYSKYPAQQQAELRTEVVNLLLHETVSQIATGKTPREAMSVMGFVVSHVLSLASCRFTLPPCLSASYIVV
jgi:hypothetical protein